MGNRGTFSGFLQKNDHGMTLQALIVKLCVRWIRELSLGSGRLLPGGVGCPKICDSGPILMLIKPICPYGILILQNDFRENPTIFDPPPKARKFRRPGLLYENFFFRVQTSIVPHFFRLTE